jgi:hypothetical protein
MIESTIQKTFEDRIAQTLRLAEERGYNLTVEQLSVKLTGGSVFESSLREILPSLTTIKMESDFVATTGQLQLEKCKQRQHTNRILQPYYQQIATQFIDEYTRLCPWVTCMLLSGSMASEGLGNGDDIDFDLIVPDGMKYTSYLLGLLLSFKYSLLYGKRFWRRYVICISVIWETNQVLPFQRNDGQLAFELLNAKVVSNPDFFRFLIGKNQWLNQYFPQIFQQVTHSTSSSYLQPQKRLLGTFIEWSSKNILFMMVKAAMATVFKDHDVKQRMMIKYPYALFDEP